MHKQPVRHIIPFSIRMTSAEQSSAALAATIIGFFVVRLSRIVLFRAGLPARIHFLEYWQIHETVKATISRK
jgi:hypothetical protein